METNPADRAARFHGALCRNPGESERRTKDKELLFYFMLIFVAEQPLVYNPLDFCSVPVTMLMAEPKCEIRLMVNHRCAARVRVGPGNREVVSAEHTTVTRCALHHDRHNSPDGGLFTQGLKTLNRGDSRERRGESS